MGKKRSELSSDEKREQRFKRWLSPEDINFINPKAERLYREKITRVIDAIKLKVKLGSPASCHWKRNKSSGYFYGCKGLSSLSGTS